jgi:hypothetical protein
MSSTASPQELVAADHELKQYALLGFQRRLRQELSLNFHQRNVVHSAAHSEYFRRQFSV